MLTDIACRAAREGRLLELQYDGHHRAVEVHAVGYSKTGEALMRAWQVSGGSASGEKAGWKLMRLADVAKATISEEASAAPRRQYKRGDPALARIICEI